MGYEHSDGSASASSWASTTIVVSGGFGVGKTTFVGAVSETMPLRTEALVRNAAPEMDEMDGVEDMPAKNATTVEVDFGRITLDDSDLMLYLFGTPGPRRLWFVWDDLIRGAIGAIVLADGRRLRDSLSAAAFFEARSLPFLVAVNEFDDAPRHSMHAVRTALTLADHVPVVSVDARNRDSAMATVIAVMEYSLSTLTPLRG